MTDSNGSAPTDTIDQRDLQAEVTGYVIKCLTGMENVNGVFFRSEAVQRDDGYITISINRIGFGLPDITIRTLLHLATPVIVPAEEPAAEPALPVGVGELDVPPNAA